MTNQPLAVVTRCVDGEPVSEFVHPAAAEVIAHHFNRNLYNQGPYCEVRDICKIPD